MVYTTCSVVQRPGEQQGALLSLEEAVQRRTPWVKVSMPGPCKVYKPSGGGGGPHECRTFPCILQIAQSSVPSTCPQQGLGGRGQQHLELGTRWDLPAPGLSFFFPFALKRRRESLQAVETSHRQQLTPSRLERGRTAPHRCTHLRISTAGPPPEHQLEGQGNSKSPDQTALKNTRTGVK